MSDVPQWVKETWHPRWWNVDHAGFREGISVWSCLAVVGITAPKLFAENLAPTWEGMVRFFPGASEELLGALKDGWFCLNKRQPQQAQEQKMPEAHRREAFLKVKDAVVKGKNAFYQAVRGTDMAPCDLEASLQALEAHRGGARGSKRSRAMALGPSWRQRPPIAQRAAKC